MILEKFVVIIWFGFWFLMILSVLVGFTYVIIFTLPWFRFRLAFDLKVIQGDPNQNFWSQMTTTLKLNTSDIGTQAFAKIHFNSRI